MMISKKKTTIFLLSLYLLVGIFTITGVHIHSGDEHCTNHIIIHFNYTGHDAGNPSRCNERCSGNSLLDYVFKGKAVKSSSHHKLRKNKSSERISIISDLIPGNIFKKQIYRTPKTPVKPSLFSHKVSSPRAPPA